MKNVSLFKNQTIVESCCSMWFPVKQDETGKSADKLNAATAIPLIGHSNTQR
jgi:hypothetical protein